MKRETNIAIRNFFEKHGSLAMYIVIFGIAAIIVIGATVTRKNTAVVLDKAAVQSTQQLAAEVEKESTDNFDI